MASAREFDLNPHPRILPMLGEINLIQWRCVAELVDNSVDAFLSAKRANTPVPQPEVAVSIPTSDDMTAKITVRDNASGMDLSTLENAVKAGWTGNDPINNLGMFGMGFNIATARLGTVTRVWTTREMDSEWYGLEINFDSLIQQKHFKTVMITRPKTDPHESGTEVSVERLKPEQRQWFAKVSNRTKLGKELGRAYSTMLRPNGHPVAFALKLNGQTVRGRDHCIWGGEGNDNREVQTARYGIVSAYQPVDVRLGDRPFCMKCWQWLSAAEGVCPSCETKDSVAVRHRHVRGWIGIQRHLSESDYGIDFVRHGRKIETTSKELFQWTTDGVAEEEYPIDDPRHRGRIVGEIHLDHCRVTYMKDRFERTDPAWEEMVRIVRGEGPLRPDKAEQLGFGQNTSPLFLLFQAFRRSSPKPKVAGCYKKLLIVPDNEQASVMAQKFYQADPDFQTDRKWWDLVEEADRQLLVATQTPQPPPNVPPLEGFGAPPAAPSPQESVPPPATQPAPPPPLRVSLPTLTREYRDDVTNQRWDIRAYRVDATDPAVGRPDRPWALKTSPQGYHEFFVQESHEVFRSATLTPLDALLAELSWAAMDFQRGNPANASFAGILSSLRDKYAGVSRLDAASLSTEAGMALTEVARSLSRNLNREDSRAIFDEMTSTEREAILQQMATRGAPQTAIDDGRFLEYAPRKAVLSFLQKHPEFFFDGRYWNDPFSTLDYGSASATEEARAQIVRFYGSLLTDVTWLAEQDPGDLANASRPRLLRAALAIELLSPGDTEDPA